MAIHHAAAIATLFLATTAHVDAVVSLSCDPTGMQTSAWPLSAQTTTIRFEDSTEGALYEIEERGIDLLLREPSATDPASPSPEAIEIGTRPARLGLLLAKARPGELIQIHPRGQENPDAIAGLLRLHCAPDANLHATLECLPSAAQTTSIAEVDATDADLPPRCAAIAAHSAAIAKFRAGRQEEAAALYERAAEHWRRLGDPARHAAAQLGLSETLSRRSRHFEAIEHAVRAEALAEGVQLPYFANRSTYQRCLSLHHTGQLTRSSSCLESLPPRYLAEGEISEAANAMILLAHWAREEGRLEKASRILAEVDALPQERISPLIRARVFENRAAIEAEAGRIGAALALYETALAGFEQVPSPPGIAYTYLSAARLHAAMAADAEAIFFADSAAEAFAAIQMPAQQAGAIFLRARVEAERGEIAQALNSLNRAEDLDGVDNHPGLLLQLALLGWTLEPTPVRWTRIESLLTGEFELTPRLQFDLAGARARMALSNDQAAAAIAELTAHEAGASNLARRVTYERLLAQAEAQNDSVPAARARMDSMIAHIRNVAAQAQAPELRQIAARRLLELRSTWIDTIDFNDSSTAFTHSVARMLFMTDPGGLLKPNQPPVTSRPADEHDQRELDRRLARILIESGRDQGDLLQAQRATWTRHGRASNPTSSASSWSEEAWRDSQARLQPDEVLILIGLGQRHSAAIVVRHDRLDLHRLDHAQAIRMKARQLTDRVARRDAAIAQIEEAARALSDELIPRQPGAVPAHLRLLVDESLADIPFALLHWPGQPGPLIETTTVSLISSTLNSVAKRKIDLEAPTSGIHVFIAAKPIAADQGGLPRLHNAEIEHALIATAVPERLVEARPLSADGLRETLIRPGAWIHVAGHGDALGGLQGYAGLWADAESGATETLPQFISWPSLVGQPVQAHLVVLNACTLAGTGAWHINRTSSFAAALQAAGATHLVAALWPVSDGAAARWVPAFYEQLQSTPKGSRGDPAHALRAAQLTLRNSRAFRHPFFWASLVHFTHL